MGTVHTLNSSMSHAPDDSAEKWSEPEFKRIFLEHHTRIIAIVLRLLGDPMRAEEVTNDAFMRLYQQPAVGRATANISGWLYRTATNLGIDALRASTRRVRYEGVVGRVEEDTSSQGPLSTLIAEEKRSRVRAVLASIRPAQAQLLILRAQGFSYKELSEILNLKQSGIGTMLNRAEAEFRECYLQLHGNEEGL